MRINTIRSFAFAAAAVAALGFQSVTAGSVIFFGAGVNPGNGNNPLAGSAEFDFSGTTLTVTLTNTSITDVMVPSDVLTAMFWSMDVGGNTLTPASGLLAAGSSVFYDADGQPAGGVIGGEWAYKAGLAFNGSSFGISSTGLNMFGPGDLFPGPGLEPPVSPDGPQYGLLSAGDNTATGNTGVLDSGGMIKNSVVFTVTGLPANFSLSSISNVLLQYGTDVSEPLLFTPEPGTLTLLALGGLLIARRRRA